MAVFLVRHAHAGDREDWEGDDRKRPLSKKGWKQARGLVGQLEPLGVRQLISSPYVRCVQTVEPLAERLGLEIEKDDRLAEGAGLGALDLVREAGEGAALCTHGDICADILGHLARQGVVKGGLQAEKGSTWVLELEGERIVAAHYLRAPK
jgi:phosphohistidine phosphatase SixA